MKEQEGGKRISEIPIAIGDVKGRLPSAFEKEHLKVSAVLRRIFLRGYSSGMILRGL